MAVTDIGLPSSAVQREPVAGRFDDRPRARGAVAARAGRRRTTAGEREPLAVALVLLESLPLIARRRFPVAVLAITFGATFGHVLLAPQGASVSEGFGSLVALYTVAERRDRPCRCRPPP